MLPKGRQLTINAMAKGSIKVAVLDESGRPLPKFALDESIEVTGDSLEHSVRWKQAGEVLELSGRPVRLEFHLNNASIYSFRIR